VRLFSLFPCSIQVESVSESVTQLFIGY
jgi:hypothetical protein